MSEVVFVGTSDAFGAGGRRTSAAVLRHPRGSVLLDCGPATGTGFQDLGIERTDIDAILLSHYHGDHFGGVPFFVLASLYEDRRERPLTIAGPPGVRDRVERLAEALGFGVEKRELGFELHFRDLPTGQSCDLGRVRVRSFETLHPKEVCPHGLQVDVDGQRVVFSGDTGWFDKLPEHAEGADLFICECTSYDRAYAYHLNYVTLQQRREQFQCRRTILTHLGPEMADLRGRIEFETADDGLVVPV